MLYVVDDNGAGPEATLDERRGYAEGYVAGVTEERGQSTTVPIAPEPLSRRWQPRRFGIAGVAVGLLLTVLVLGLALLLTRSRSITVQQTVNLSQLAAHQGPAVDPPAAPAVEPTTAARTARPGSAPAPTPVHHAVQAPPATSAPVALGDPDPASAEDADDTVVVPPAATQAASPTPRASSTPTTPAATPEPTPSQAPEVRPHPLATIVGGVLDGVGELLGG